MAASPETRGSSETSALHEETEKTSAIGFHLSDEQDLAALGMPDGIVVTREIGHDPWNRAGAHFDVYAELGMQVICRLNHGLYPKGTVPFSQNYGSFARRCANFVAASSGCHVWIIGNEPNARGRWPSILTEGEGDANRTGETPVVLQQSVPDDADDAASDASQAGSFAQNSDEKVPWWRRILRRGMSPTARADVAESSHGNESDGERLEDAGEYSSARPGGYAAGGISEHPAVEGRFSALAKGEVQETVPARPYGFVEALTPRRYVACYRMCRRAIRAVPGHENDLVLPAGLAPWTNHARYAANPEGDWIIYFGHILGLLSPQECDGLALHVYTPPVGAKFARRGRWTEEYARLLAAIPEAMRKLPIFVTECGAVNGWEGTGADWLNRFLAQTQELFAAHGYEPRIYALAHEDAGLWQLSPERARSIGLAGHLRVSAPVRVRPHTQPQHTPIARNDTVLTTTVVNMRRSAGYLDKAAGDIIAELAGGVRLDVVGGTATNRDGLRWWQVRVAQGQGDRHSGWVAESSPDGRSLLVRATGHDAGSIRVGVQIRAVQPTRVRRSAGYLGKPNNDVLGEAAAGSQWTVRSGPRAVDDLTWWELDGGAASSGLRGWCAETAPGGLRLFIALEGGDSGSGGTPPAPVAPVVGQFRPGDRVITLAYVRMRRSPGLVNKPENDVVADIWLNTDAVILRGPQRVDELTWYEAEAYTQEGTRRGWMAESAPGGMPLLGVREARFEEDFALGELVVVGSNPLRVRRSPGVNGKSDEDVLGEFHMRTTLNILSRMQTVDDMRWWRVGGIATHGPVRGWVAQSTPQGVALVRRPPQLPGTNIPNRASGQYLHRPFAGRFGISQLWGQNRSLYSRFTYDGVPLLGHNGIDFLTPTGTPVLATAAGVVSAAAFEAGGFGNYVVLEHAWGQSIYAHLDSMSVGARQNVSAGQTLGFAGNSGNSTGPHLHFAIRIHPYVRTDGWGGFSDPLPYMAPGDVLLPAYVQDEAVQDVWPQPLLDLINLEPLPPPGMLEETPGMVRP